jgi:hypothetical protein
MHMHTSIHACIRTCIHLFHCSPGLSSTSFISIFIRYWRVSHGSTFFWRKSRRVCITHGSPLHFVCANYIDPSAITKYLQHDVIRDFQGFQHPIGAVTRRFQMIFPSRGVILFVELAALHAVLMGRGVSLALATQNFDSFETNF